MPVLAVALLVAVALGGCAGATGPSTSESGSVVGSSGTESLVEGRPQVTVPGLGGESIAVSPPAVGPAELPAGGVPDAGSTGDVAAEAGPVQVRLAECADCQVLGTHANVVDGYSAALISQGGRAVIAAIDPSGAPAGILAVPYGVTFAAPADGRLACGAGGRCIVVAAMADGRAVLSAYGLAADGTWTDLSGSGGFVSATAKGLPVSLEDELGAAVQDTDGTRTVWNVLSWNGSAFATLGCGPDADTPDLTSLDLALCLS